MRADGFMERFEALRGERSVSGECRLPTTGAGRGPSGPRPAQHPDAGRDA